MKKIFLITGLAAVVAANSYGQGTIAFKTIGGTSKVYSATDGTSASLAAIPTDGTVGSFGTVSYEIYSAPTGTAAPTTGQAADGTTILIFGAGWNAIAVGPVTYSGGAGVVLPAVTITLPSQSGAAGNPVELEIVAYTGPLGNPTLYGYSGNPIITGAATPSAGALEWTNATGNPGGTPTVAAQQVANGSSAFGSMILVGPASVPEPSTIALGGLAAAALLAFRRRK